MASGMRDPSCRMAVSLSSLDYLVWRIRVGEWKDTFPCLILAGFQVVRLHGTRPLLLAVTMADASVVGSWLSIHSGLICVLRVLWKVSVSLQLFNVGVSFLSSDLSTTQVLLSLNANRCLHTDPYGADVRCCGGPRGCCGSCCDSSFDEDDFEERLKKEQAKNGANAEPVDSQPVPSHGMSTVTGDPKPTMVEV
jgi:hypothetical protein